MKKYETCRGQSGVDLDSKLLAMFSELNEDHKRLRQSFKGNFLFFAPPSPLHVGERLE